jgi:tetratricopeptide (TPR) repeat protein
LALALALAGDAPGARAIADGAASRFPEDTLLNKHSLPIVYAAIELQRGRPLQAIELLRPAEPYELATAPFVRGLAYLRAGAGAEAVTEFQKIVSRPFIQPLLPEHPLARLGLARAYALSGDVDQSRKWYEDFLERWKDADPDVPVLLEAKREYAALLAKRVN